MNPATVKHDIFRQTNLPAEPPEGLLDRTPCPWPAPVGYENELVMFLPGRNLQQKLDDFWHQWDHSRFLPALSSRCFVFFQNDRRMTDLKVDVLPPQMPQFRRTTPRVPEKPENLTQPAGLAGGFQESLVFLRCKRTPLTIAVWPFNPRKGIRWDELRLHAPIEGTHNAPHGVVFRPIAYPRRMLIDPFRQVKRVAVSYQPRPVVCAEVLKVNPPLVERRPGISLDRVFEEFIDDRRDGWITPVDGGLARHSAIRR